MEWHLDKSRPICPQLCEQLCVWIAGGAFAPHERLPSVREMAVSAEVNPNTVQKSFEELEQQGLLYSVRGSGWFVGEDPRQAAQTVRSLQSAKTALYFEEMHKLGLDDTMIKDYVKEWNG